MVIAQIPRWCAWLATPVCLVLLFWFAATFCSVSAAASPCSQDYLCQPKPTDQPVVFAPGIVSTGLPERDMTISPDGKEMFFSVLIDRRGFIVWIHRQGDTWSHPEVAWFSGRYSDLEPAFTPDGKRLFFVSNRPKSGRGKPKKDFDIWYIERKNSGWSAPYNPGPPLNSSNDEFYPSVARNGTIYFCAGLKTSLGGEDIFRSRWIKGRYTPPENVSPEINTKGQEFNACIAPDEDYLVFTTTGRGSGQGGGDLWVSFQTEEGWSRPVNLGKEINSPSLDFCPFVTFDGRYLFFTSRRSKVDFDSSKPMKYEQIQRLAGEPGNGQSDIYWVSARHITGLREKALGSKKNLFNKKPSILP